MLISGIIVWIKGGGDIASGVAWRLHHCGFRVLITELQRPMAVRRRVAFCEAVYDGRAEVEGVEAVRIGEVADCRAVWEDGKIPLMVDPKSQAARVMGPAVLVDATIAKRNTGTSMQDAPLVIGLGPGFVAGRDVHCVVETHRGHYLGRLVTRGSALPNTGVPGPIEGITSDRVLRAPIDGVWENTVDIGDRVKKGDRIGSVAGEPVAALIDGVLRGMIRPGILVTRGLKIGDIDPRGIKAYCDTISEKAMAIAGGVLEGILRFSG